MRNLNGIIHWILGKLRSLRPHIVPILLTIIIGIIITIISTPIVSIIYPTPGEPIYTGQYTGQWTLQTESAEWSPRYLAGSVVMPDGSIVLMGGSASNGELQSDVWRSVDNGVSWTQMTANAEWSGREAMGAVALPDGSIVIMGGGKDNVFYWHGTHYNDVWRSVDNGASWIQMTANAEWDARLGFGSVALSDGSIVIMGGVGNRGTYADVWQSKDLGATWTRLSPFAWIYSNKSFGCVVTADDGIVVMGGRPDGGSRAGIWVSRDKGMTWSPVGDSNHRMYPGAVVMPDGSIVLMGGIVGGLYRNDVWRSEDDGATWTEIIPSSKWSPRAGFGYVSTSQGHIVLMGGGQDTLGGGPHYKNDVWLFTPT